MSPPGREAYRQLPRASRKAETKYADRLDHIVDTLAFTPNDTAPIVDMADDLSGVYGPFPVAWKGSVGYYQEATIDGVICDGPGVIVGRSTRTFVRDGYDYLIVSNDYLALSPPAQGRGFATALYDELEVYYRRSDVDVIKVHAALQNGGYTWARRGFDWDPRELWASFSDIRARISELIDDQAVAEEDKRLLSRIADRLDENDPGQDWPTPNELARLSGKDPDLGRTLMAGSNWYGVFPLSDKGLSYGTD